MTKADLDAITTSVAATSSAGKTPAVRELVECAGRRLAVLRRLPTGRRPWGRRVAGARALAHVFLLLHPTTGATT